MPEPLTTEQQSVLAAFTIFFHERDGKMQSVPARYTFVYKKVNDTWKIIEQHSSVMPA